MLCCPREVLCTGPWRGGSKVDGDREKEERRRRGVGVGVHEMEGGYGWKREG